MKEFLRGNSAADSVGVGTGRGRLA